MWDLLLFAVPILVSFLFLLLAIRDWRDSSGNAALLPIALVTVSLMAFLGGAAVHAFQWGLGFSFLALAVAARVVLKRSK